MNNNNQHAAKVLRGTGANLLGAVSRNALGFVFVIALARLLNKRDLGTYYLAMAVVNFAAIIGTIGLDTGIKRFVSISHGRGDANTIYTVLKTGVGLGVAVSCLVGVGLFLSSDTVAIRIFSKPQLASVLKLLSIYVPLLCVTKIVLGATQGLKYMRFNVYAMDVTAPLLRIIGMFCLYAIGMRLNAAVFAQIVSLGVVMSLSVWFLNGILPNRSDMHDTETAAIDVKELLSFSAPQAFSGMIGVLLATMDVLMLGFFASSEVVGVYSTAVKILAIGTVVLASFNTMFAPLVSDLHSRQEIDVLRDLYCSITKWIVALSLPFFVFLMCYPYDMLGVIDNQFTTGALALVILCAGQIVNAGTGPAGILILMSGYSYVNLANNVAAIFVNFTLNVLLIPRYGMAGAAVATASAMVLINLVRLIEAKIIVGIFPYRWGHIKLLVAVLASVFGTVTVGRWLGPDMAASRLLELFGVFLLIYFCTLLGLGLDVQDRYFLSRVRTRFGNMVGHGFDS